MYLIDLNRKHDDKKGYLLKYVAAPLALPITFTIFIIGLWRELLLLPPDIYKSYISANFFLTILFIVFIIYTLIFLFYFVYEALDSGIVLTIFPKFCRGVAFFLSLYYIYFFVTAISYIPIQLIIIPFYIAILDIGIEIIAIIFLITDNSRLEFYIEQKNQLRNQDFEKSDAGRIINANQNNSNLGKMTKKDFQCTRRNCIIPKGIEEKARDFKHNLKEGDVYLSENTKREDIGGMEDDYNSDFSIANVLPIKVSTTYEDCVEIGKSRTNIEFSMTREEFNKVMKQRGDTFPSRVELRWKCLKDPSHGEFLRSLWRIKDKFTKACPKCPIIKPKAQLK